MRDALSPLRYLLLLFALAALSLLGNWLNVPLFFGVDLIFGSVAVILAVAWLGVWGATLVALVGATYTWILWGQPFSMIAFVLEGLIVACLYHRLKLRNMVLADLFFWGLVGIPVVGFCYGVVLDLAASAVGLIALKQAVNGVFNALLASLLLLSAAYLRKQAGLLSLSSIVFHCALSAILLVGMVPILFDARTQREQHETMMAWRLTEVARVLVTRLNADSAPDQRLDYHLSRVQSMFPAVTVALLDSQGKTPGSVSGISLHSMTPAFQSEQTSSREGLNIWLPPGSLSAVARWRQGYYWVSVPVAEPSGLRIVVEHPAAQLVGEMESQRLSRFALLAGMFFCAILLSGVLSRLLSRSVSRIAAASQVIAANVQGGQFRPLSRHRVLELDKLSLVLNDMGTELAGSVRALQLSRGQLQESVASQTRQLAEANGLLTSVLDAAEDFSIIATDCQGLITLFNAGAERMLGYSAEEMIGRTTSLVLHEPGEIEHQAKDLAMHYGVQVSGFKVLVTEAELGIRQPREWTYLCKDGQPVLVRVVVTMIHGSDGSITGFLGIAEDISERKRLEQVKSEFIATVSHELRTPLTSISGALGMLQAGALGALSDQAMDMVRLAHNNSQRLTALINDLLDIEKLAAGKLQFDPCWVSLPESLRQAASGMTAYADDQSIRIEMVAEIPAVKVHVDEQRLQQILSNLLSNAIKFSPRGGRIKLSAGIAGDCVRVMVTDQGAGVPDSFKARIFQRFAQADSTDRREKGGTGLGLAISKELVESMGGRIGFVSPPDEGATFWIEFPYKED